MDIASVAGMIAGWVVIILGIVLAGGQAGNFIDIPSVFVTMGGSLCALFLSFPMSSMKSIMAVTKLVFKPQSFDPA